MGQKEKKENIILFKLLYTVIIILVYLIGKGLPLYMIDLSAYIHKTVEAEDLLIQTISGDIYQCSLFALGISPYMISSMLVQIISAFRKSEIRSKISPKKTNKQILGVTLVIATIQAIIQAQELIYRVSGSELIFAKTVASIEMVAGAMIIIWLASRNKQYGIGGQSAIIFVNILDGIIKTLRNSSFTEAIIPVSISIMVMMVIIFMENSEVRIPVQRISIHNIYADKNYLAIKLNPIGVMPAMFSTAAFMVPQLIIMICSLLMPENGIVLWLKENVTLNQPVGIVVYLSLVYILSIGFSRVFVNPGELTEQFLKSGDSLRDIHAGSDTKKYLSRTINRVSIASATILCICLCIPMLLQMSGGIQTSLATLPSSVMMLTGIWCNLYREARAVKDLEAYRPFI